MPAGDQQGDRRRRQRAMFQLVDGDVRGQVIDPVQRLAESERVRLGRSHPDQQGAAAARRRRPRRRSGRPAPRRSQARGRRPGSSPPGAPGWLPRAPRRRTGRAGHAGGDGVGQSCPRTSPTPGPCHRRSRCPVPREGAPGEGPSGQHLPHDHGVDAGRLIVPAPDPDLGETLPQVQSLARGLSSRTSSRTSVHPRRAASSTSAISNAVPVPRLQRAGSTASVTTSACGPPVNIIPAYPVSAFPSSATR